MIDRTAVVALALVTALLSAPSVVAQQDGADAVAEMHWAQRLAIRAAARERTTEVVEQVVLVPDAATYLDEIGRWTLDRRWPVLIEDEHLTPKFVRAFAPKRVVRRGSIGAPPRGDALRTAIVATVLVTLGAPPPTEPPTPESLMNALDAHLGAMGDPPPGIVILVPDDSAWTAAVAIAAARALPVRWLPRTFGRPNDTLPAARALELTRAVNGLVDSTPWRWRTLGDDIETICVCGNLAVRSMLERGARADGGSEVVVATTDLLGRLPDQSRGAFAGWIHGSEANAAHIAMSSIFLPRRNAMLYNSYGDTQPWAAYGFDLPRRHLGEAGFDLTIRTGESASAATWEQSLRGGWSYDFVMANSAGNADFFQVGSGQRRNSADVPILNTPAAVHFIHSWSFRAPTNMGTIAARFIAHGAYAYVGSVEEPGLSAFMPPQGIAPRLVASVPFLVAVRWWPPEPLSQPWRVATFGDPLMTLAPPSADPRRRVEPPADGVEDLRSQARRLMARANEERCAETLTKAIGALRVLAEDRIATELHRAGVAAGFADADAARAALPAYFILDDAAGFRAAWEMAGATGFPYEDMAWHLLLPRFSAGDRTTALLLESALRAPRQEADALRLYRRMIEIIGRDEARAFLQRAIDRMPNEARAKVLRDELNRR